MIPGIAAGVLSGGAGPPATLSSPWSDISFAHPTTTGANEDRTIAGSGTVTADALTAGLEYRINTGSWTVYGGGFSISSGQTLAWRVNTLLGPDQSATENIRVNGHLLDTFNVTTTGFP